MEKQTALTETQELRERFESLKNELERVRRDLDAEKKLCADFRGRIRAPYLSKVENRNDLLD